MPDVVHPGGPGSPARMSGPWIKQLVVAACWIYAAAVVGFCALVHWSSADFWPVHLLLYGPRWAFALPMLILIPLATWRRSRWASAALWVGSAGFLAFWGFVVPAWGRGGPMDDSQPTLRMLTCNVQYTDLKIEALARLIEDSHPDIVVLQECFIDNPKQALFPQGWHLRQWREFCVASRDPIASFLTLQRPDKPSRTFAVRAEVIWQGHLIPVVATHLMTPRRGLEAIIRSPIRGWDAFRAIAVLQRMESRLLRKWVADVPRSVLLAGDFNLTPEHPLYRQDWSDLANAFTESGAGLGETMSTWKIGLRIDHVLHGTEWRAIHAWVGPDVGSAHRPLLADLAWIGKPVDPEH